MSQAALEKEGNLRPYYFVLYSLSFAFLPEALALFCFLFQPPLTFQVQIQIGDLSSS